MIILGVFANFFSGLLFWWFKRLERDVDNVKAEVQSMRLNYINRFDDVKDHNNELHLKLVEKLSILDRKISEFSVLKIRR